MRQALVRSSTDGPTWVWALLALGLAFSAVGASAYVGRWRSWTRSVDSLRFGAPGAAWLGACAVLCFLAVAAQTAAAGPSGEGGALQVVAALLFSAAVVAFMVAALSPFWMWSVLQPRWFRTASRARSR